jgi:2-methylcitrate dehydratase PrpD
LVDVDMVDGTTLSARCEHPLGSSENPLTRPQIEQKLRTYAEGVLSAAQVAKLIGAIDSLQDLSSVGELMNLLRAAPPAMAAAE